MLNLFKTELIQYRKWAFGFAILYFLVLYFLYSIGQPYFVWPISNVWLLFWATVSAGFGILQMKMHKRPNEWLFLLHRPLSHQKIFLSITLAGFCLLLVMITLPLILLLMIMDIDGRLLIEFRHYLFPLYAIALLFTTYLIGCFTVLNPSRISFLALALCSQIMVMYLKLNDTVLLNSLIITALAFLMAFRSFKPDLDKNHNTIRDLLLAEIPIQFGLLWLLALAVNTYFLITSGADSPLRNPAVDTDYYALNMEPEVRMQYALENSDHPEAAFLTQQLNLSEASTVNLPDRFSHARRHQLPQWDNKLTLFDSENNTSWTFSHSAMLFEGSVNNTEQQAGWLGVKGFSQTREQATPFASIPWTEANRYILVDQEIYQVDWDAQSLSMRYKNERDETFTDSLSLSENLSTIFSDTSLSIFSSREFQDINFPLQARGNITIPALDIVYRNQIDVTELIDGFLVSALINVTPYGVVTDFSIINKARLLLYRIKPGQENEIIAEIHLPSSFSDSFIYNTLVISPGLRIATELILNIRNSSNNTGTVPILNWTIPEKIFYVTLLFSLFSAGMTAILLRHSTLPRRLKVFWIVLNGFSGLVGLASFLLGTYWQKTEQLGINLIQKNKPV